MSFTVREETSDCVCNLELCQRYNSEMHEKLYVESFLSISLF